MALSQTCHIALDSQLNLLYDNCYKCALTQTIPKEIISDETKTDAEYPHIQFHADVIRRAKQIILTIKDHFSSFQDAMLLNSEKAEERNCNPRFTFKKTSTNLRYS